MLANKTFWWVAIAALDGEWVADDEMAELRFTREGIACRLWYAAAGATWIVGCDAMNEAYVVMAGVETSPTLAAYRLGVVVGALWRAIQDANEVEV